MKHSSRESPSPISKQTSLSHGGLKRTLGKWHLTALGVGATIGAGIFATTGTAIVGDAARPGAGPAIIFSFILTAVACGFAALCYAEFAAMVPISGSAYTYAYASLGEFVAWIIGWDLIIEYAVGNIGVAIGWAGYFRELLNHFGLDLPPWLATDYRSAHDAFVQVAAAGATKVDETTAVPRRGLERSAALSRPSVHHQSPGGRGRSRSSPSSSSIGIKESADANNAMVLLKVGIILFFIAVGAFLIHPQQLDEPDDRRLLAERRRRASAPRRQSSSSPTSDSTPSRRRPRRRRTRAKDMPFGIIMSLVITTILYIAISIVMTGMAPWKQLGTAEPMITALQFADGPPALLNASRFIIALGAVIAMGSVLLVFQLGQPRIFFSMSRDGLLPPVLAKIHPKYKTPYVGDDSHRRVRRRSSPRSPTSPKSSISRTSERCSRSCSSRPA